MKLYWTMRSIPELADLDAPARRHVWRAAYKRACYHPFLWVGVLILFLYMYIILEIYNALFGIRGYGGMIIVICNAVLGSLIYSQFVVLGLRGYLKTERDKYLTERGA